MRLPGATAYMEALQHPASCFADPELAAATPVLGPLGLPRAVSGNVAVVFRVEGEGGRSWAVRCFVRPVDEERARYDAIQSHLGGLGSSWRVPFDLQPCGIRIDGTWWPVLKMAWAPGEPLLRYVERHLWDGAALGYLTARFAALAGRLRSDGVAHGDLQHGNILVAPGGDLRLVDYDGMYVPALAGRGGIERGHRNYQHPGREVGDFEPGLDSFSAWAIYASLAALAADPLLWGRLDGGEETLLLRHHDLARPDRSAALAAMEASEAAGVAELAGLLRSFLSLRPSEVPSLSPRLAPPLATAPGRVPAPGPSGAMAMAMAGGGGAMGASARTGTGAEEAAAAAAAAAAEDRRSLYDALTATATTVAGAAGVPGVNGETVAAPAAARAAAATAAFAGDLHEPRVTMVAGAAAAVVVLVVALAAGAGPVVAAAAAMATAGAALARLHRLFLLTHEARTSRLFDAEMAEPRRAVDEAVAALDRLARRRAGVSASEAAAAARAAEERAGLRAGEERELQAVDARLEVSLAAVAEQERGLARAEQEARAAALAELQRAAIEAQLGQHSLVAAAACGVSDTVVHRLALDGVRTAADFTGVVVEKAGGVVVRRDGRRLLVTGVDQRQAAAMLTWRRRVTDGAQLKTPGALPPERLSAIRAQSDAVRAGLAGEAEAARAEARRLADEIRARWRAEHERVVQRQKEVEADAAGQRVELDRDLALARKDVAEAEWRLARHLEGAGAPSAPGLAAYLRQVVAVGPLAGATFERWSPASRTAGPVRRDR